jgi:hypothetical protein
MAAPNIGSSGMIQMCSKKNISSSQFPVRLWSLVLGRGPGALRLVFSRRPTTKD